LLESVEPAFDQASYSSYALHRRTQTHIIEEATLANNTRVQFESSGCAHISQSFRFEISTASTAAPGNEWLAKAAELIRSLRLLDSQQLQSSREHIARTLENRSQSNEPYILGDAIEVDQVFQGMVVELEKPTQRQLTFLTISVDTAL